MKNKFKVKHKKEGWTATIEFGSITPEYWASHRFGFNIHAVLLQDEHDEKGNYHEDPEFYSLEEFELIS